MTPEQLLELRYKVIAEYPETELPIGVILTFDIESVYLRKDGKLFSTKIFPFAMGSSYYYRCVLNIGNYPHLFQKLEWWQDRDEKDLPEYIRLNQKMVVKVDTHFANYITLYGKPSFLAIMDEKTKYEYPYDIVKPATKEEYDNYISNQK